MLLACAMRGAWMAALFALSFSLFHTDEAEAFNGCNEACAYVGYAIITGGGITAAIGSQVSILEGEPDESWGYLSLGLAGANAATSGVLLIIAGVAAAIDEDEMAEGFAIWGGLQMTVAVAALVSGATVVANVASPPGELAKPQPAGASITIPF